MDSALYCFVTASTNYEWLVLGGGKEIIYLIAEYKSRRKLKMKISVAVTVAADIKGRRCPFTHLTRYNKLSGNYFIASSGAAIAELTGDHLWRNVGPYLLYFAWNHNKGNLIFMVFN